MDARGGDGSRRGALVAVARSGAVLAVATTAANALGYGLVLVLTRTLSAGELGAAGALLNLAVIGMVPGLALQLVVAREVAAPGPDGPPTLRDAALAGAGTGLALALAVAAAAPLLEQFLRLGSAWPAVLAGAWLVPSTTVLAVQGVLQGAERFGALALVLVAAAAVRPAAALAAARSGGGTATLFALLTAGTVFAVGLALRTAARSAPTAVPSSRPADRPGRPPATTQGHRPADRRTGLRGGVRGTGVRPVLTAMVPATLATAGLLTLANVDVLLARNVLPAAASGAYAVGAVFAKAALWGPQFVSTLVFPRMARSGRERAVRWSLLACGAAGLAATGLCAVLGGPLVAVVGGDRYAALAGSLWVFAALGGALALVQVLLWARLAVGDRRLAVAAWVCIAGLVVAVRLDPAPTVPGVAGRALAVTLVLVAAGLLAERAALSGRRPEPTPTGRRPRPAS